MDVIDRQTARDQLISDYVGMARNIALKMARRYPVHVDRDDIVAAAMLGLTEAASRFDESRCEPFMSFAERRVRGAVIDELRRGDVLTRNARKLARKVNAARRDLEQRGIEATDELLAEACGVSVEEFVTDIKPRVTVEHKGLNGTLVASEPRQDAQLIERRERQDVKDAMDELPPRELTCLELHYFEERPYYDIGRSIGVTPARVYQLCSRALERVRATLAHAA
jgi:RNA polymerase sigma factor FliA